MPKLEPVRVVITEPNGKQRTLRQTADESDQVFRERVAIVIGLVQDLARDRLRGPYEAEDQTEPV